MAALDTFRKIAAFKLKALGYLSFLPPLLTRLLIGYAFYQTGSGKLSDLDKPTQFFSNLGIPFPRANAFFIAHLECYGGILLMIGLLTRPIAALLGATMVVALMTAHKDDVAEKWFGDLTDIVPVVYGMFMLWLLVYGPGLLSVDAVLRRVLGIDTKPEAPKE